MQEIFSNQLLNYLELATLFKKVEIEGIPELYLINGSSEYKYNLLKIGESSISIPEMATLYKKIIDNQRIPSYHYEKLNLEETGNTFLVLKSEEPEKTIKMLISTMQYYLERFFYYSLEILTLLLLPSVIKIVPLKIQISKNYSNKTKTFIQNLQKSSNYREEFNNVIKNLIEGNIYINPSL